MRTRLLLLSTFLLFACSHAEPDRSAEEAATIKKLPLPAVESGLLQVDEELSQLENRIHAAEARRDSYQIQATQDANKQSAIEGAEAELSSLQSKRGTLEHRRHLLEGRKRELKGAAGEQP